MSGGVITGPIGNPDAGESFMSPEFMEVLAAESRAARGVVDTEREECMTALRAVDDSTGALLAELRGHFGSTTSWTCEDHGHQHRAEEIIDILAGRIQGTDTLGGAA